MYDKQIDRRWIGSVKAWMAAVDGTTEGFDIERLFGVNRRLS